MAYSNKYTLNWEASQDKIKKAGDVQILRGSRESIYKRYIWLSDSIFDHMYFLRNIISHGKGKSTFLKKGRGASSIHLLGNFKAHISQGKKLL